MKPLTVTMGAPFAWLMQALDVGRRNPLALFGGFLLMLAVGLVPSAAQMGGVALGGPGSWLANAGYVLSVLLGLLVMPPMMGAAFRLLHATETGAPTHATDIFDGFRDLALARRTVLLALAFVVVYLLALAVLYVVLPGKETLAEWFQRFAATPPGGEPDLSGLAAPPGGLLLWLLAACGLLLVLGNAYMLAFAQVALGRRGVFTSLRDGFAAALRNLLPFLGFALVLFFVGFVLLLIAGIVISLLAAVLMAVSPALAAGLALLLYLALMLGIYVLMFGFYYHGWRAIFAAGSLDAPPAIDAIVA